MYWLGRIEGAFGPCYVYRKCYRVCSFSPVVTSSPQIDTDEWQSTFMYVTLASVAFINVNAAIFQGGILGVAGR